MQEQWLRELQEQVKKDLDQYSAFRLPLDSARSDAELLIAGKSIFVQDVSDSSARATVKLNKIKPNTSSGDDLILKRGSEIKAVFKKLFLSNAAQAGQWLDLVVGRDFDMAVNNDVPGYDWSGWTQCSVEAVVLTTGATILETSDAISLDLKAACEVSVEATYSDHAKATGGLEVFILGECNGTYEVQADAPPGWEMEFTQNDTRRARFSVNPKEFGSCKIHFDWNNTTAGSNVTITCRYRTATI